MRVLALSPHLDDAVLSAGGAMYDLAAAGHEVVVHTMLAGIAEPPYSPLADGLHELWGLPEDPVGARRREDAEAVKHLGAVPRHGEFLDAIYRRTAGGWQFQADDVLTEPHTDEPLVSALCESVRELLSWDPDLVLTAGGVGGHLDHVLTRDAVLRACASHGVSVRLWQDLPYAGWTDRMAPLPPGVCPGPVEATAMSAEAWVAKCAAVACYASQATMLWPDHTDFRVPLAALARAAAGGAGYAEVFWPVQPATDR